MEVEELERWGIHYMELKDHNASGLPEVYYLRIHYMELKVKVIHRERYSLAGESITWS